MNYDNCGKEIKKYPVEITGQLSDEVILSVAYCRCYMFICNNITREMIVCKIESELDIMGHDKHDYWHKYA